MKKSLVLLFGVLFVGASFATYQGSSETRRAPEYKSMGFQATLSDNAVSMSWNNFTLPSKHSFVYWKVMRSQNTENPVYREDKSEYITYNGDIGFTSYTDSNPKNGTTRYRVCAITQASDGYHRYCAKEVKKITINSSSTKEPEEKEEKEVKEEKKEPKTTTLSDAQKATLDQLAAEFLKKLEEKFASDPSKKKVVLGNVVSQLRGLGKKQVKMKAMIEYLASKLEGTIDPMDEIKNILKVE